MPIYEYQARTPAKGCNHCRKAFDHLQSLSAPRLTACPDCGAELVKLISAPRVGGSQSNFDDRAKSAGFSKLKKVSTGEYEKQY